MLKLTYRELAKQLELDENAVSTYFRRNNLKIDNLHDVADYIALHKLRLR